MKKRGQVTTFMVIGFLVLVVAGLTLYMNQELLADFLIPAEIKPIVTFTQRCIADSAEQGIFLMGVQGGYINLPQEISVDPFATINNGFKVPFWYHNGKNMAPSKNQMEFELAEYINAEVALCLNDYKEFETEYDLKPLESLRTTVRIADDVILISTDITTELKRKTSDEFRTLPEFKAQVDSRLGSMHELSRSIMRVENSDAFLESLSDDMISVSPDLPYSGMELTCDDRTWTIDQIKEHVKKIIQYNIKYVHFEGTDYIDSEIPYFQKQYKFKVSNKRYPNLRVNPIYDPRWDFELDINPSKNGIVKPLEYMSTENIFTCFKLYNHQYSYTYPLLFQVINQDDPSEAFYFATPVMVKRNLPNRNGEVPLWPKEIDEQNSRVYCDETAEEQTKYLVAEDGSIYTQKVDVPRRTNTLNVYVYDGSVGSAAGQGELLDGVEISYQCVAFRCDIGNTSYPRENGVITGVMPSLEHTFPNCQNGVLIAQKPGYLTTYLQQTVDETTNNYGVMMTMEKLKPFDVRVKVIEDINGLVKERDLREDEVVLISLENSDLLYEKNIIHTLARESSGAFVDTTQIDQSTVDLVLDTVSYDVDLKLVSDDQISGLAQVSWQPDLDQLQHRGGVIFYVYKKNQGLYAVQGDALAQKEAMDAALAEATKYPPRLTLS